MYDENTTATAEYSYVQNIKTPGQLKISGKGTLSQMTKNVSGLMNYIDLLVQGKSKASKTGGPLGNKFFVRTGSSCKSKSTGDTEDRFMYINNVPSGSLPGLKQLGVKSNTLRGLIPGTLENTNALDPSAIVNSLSGGLRPECIEVKLETINKDNKKNMEKRFVSVRDIENMDACDFGKNGRNPVTKKKCRQGFSVIEETHVSKKNTKNANNGGQNAFPGSLEDSAPFYQYATVVTKSSKRPTSRIPDDALVHAFCVSVAGVAAYLVYRLVTKARR